MIKKETIAFGLLFSFTTLLKICSVVALYVHHEPDRKVRNKPPATRITARDERELKRLAEQELTFSSSTDLNLHITSAS